jgi:hypothetical protein
MADVPAAATAQDQAMDSNTTRMRERREAIVREHVDAENRRDIDAVIATFDRPRYEVNGEVSDGEGSVRGLLEEMLTAFPDFNAEDGKIHYSDDAVIAEGSGNRHPPRAVRRDHTDRPPHRLPARRDLRVRGGPARLREGLLRLGDDAIPDRALPDPNGE